MTKFALGEVLDSSFINSFTGLASGGSNSAQKAVAALRGESSQVSVSAGLRFGAQAFGRAVGGLNSLISFLQISKSTLEDLGDLADKMIDLADRASKSGTGRGKRRALNFEFDSLTGEFERTLKEAKLGDYNLLNTDDLASVFTLFGLDPEAAGSIASIFDQFLLADDEGRLKNGTGSPKGRLLASEYSKGTRPLVLSPQVFEEPVITGDGTFGASASYGTGNLGTSGQSVASGDFNGDLYQDAVTADSDGGSVSVLLGNGDGSFNASSQFTTGTAPEDVVGADFNGDGNLDLAVNDTGDGTLSVLLGNGDGSFLGRTTYVSGPDARGLTAGSINSTGDDYLDLVNVDTSMNRVSISLGNGDGTFKIRSAFGVGSSPVSAAVGDFDGDGLNDVASANSGDGTVSVLLGNGNLTFDAAQSYTAGSSPVQIKAGDLNGDGSLDLVTVDSADLTADVLLGNGDGTFQAKRSYTAGSNPGSLALGDFDGDGKLDIAVSDATDNSVDVFIGNGDGTFSDRTGFSTGGGTAPEAVAALDVNGDKALDLLTANTGGDTLGVMTANRASNVHSLTKNVSEYDSIFKSKLGIGRRAEAASIHHDLLALREQIDSNLEAIDQGLQTVEDNITLVRAAGFAFLNLSSEIGSTADAEDAARELQKRIRGAPRTAVAQAENLRTVAVAALSLDGSEFS